MKELLARVLYWFIGYVLWTIRGWDGMSYTDDNGDEWHASWWLFSEYGDEQHQTCTRAMGAMSVWHWGDEYRLTRWTGRRIHFAYRHSYGSGNGGIRSFIRMLGVAYRLGL